MASFESAPASYVAVTVTAMATNSVIQTGMGPSHSAVLRRRAMRGPLKTADAVGEPPPSRNRGVVVGRRVPLEEAPRNDDQDELTVLRALHVVAPAPSARSERGKP
jgi:hypothetical protein